MPTRSTLCQCNGIVSGSLRISDLRLTVDYADVGIDELHTKAEAAHASAALGFNEVSRDGVDHGSQKD
jgi:hypothetical protein